MTDQQLQLTLAKMLPEKFCIERVPIDNEEMVVWNSQQLHGRPPVKDTEWLHVAWLVEEALDSPDSLRYPKVLASLNASYSGGHQVSLSDFYTTHASWQQRAEALCKVKGIAI